MAELSPHGALMRRFALDWLGRVDPAVPPEIMSADYAVAIGGIELRGLNAYVPATVGQYERYLGLLLTVHDLIAAPGRIALRFTLHGAEPGRPPVAWPGIALFAHDGSVLTRSWVEEDYLARRRQRESGACDPIEAPMPAPWAAPELAGDATAEAAVRAWLAAGELAPVAPTLVKGPVEVTEMFSAGEAVAFAGVQRGVCDGADASITLVGIVRVTANGPAGHVVQDALGLARRLGGSP
jgi:hypothetical protein